jgi:hypothetical protein
MRVKTWAYIFPLMIIMGHPFITFSQTLQNMHRISADGNGDLLITPSESSSRNDFDFLVGKWNIHNKKLENRLSHSDQWMEFDATHEMHTVLAGTGNVENIFAMVNNQPYEGMAIRLFNPATRLWSIYWSDSHSGTMDKPVVGSFEKNVGIFLGKDKWEGKEVMIRFKWDATDPEKPIWSQAFSDDNGKSWEWNWFMYFSKRNDGETEDASANRHVSVIELRNYILQPGQRENFTDLFESAFIRPQQAAGSYTLGQYKVKGAENNFFWIRGFHDMASRNKALNAFYQGAVWKQNRNAANAMIVNNDNVNLLKPLNVGDSVNEKETSFHTNWFGKEKGIGVIDFYISNTKLDKLVVFVKEQYAAILRNAGIENTSFWISETAENDFAALPVFQDKNLLVQITFYKDELEYETQMKMVAAKMNDKQKTTMADLVTLKNTLIVYPTKRSFLFPVK